MALRTLLFALLLCVLPASLASAQTGEAARPSSPSDPAQPADVIVRGAGMRLGPTRPDAVARPMQDADSTQAIPQEPHTGAVEAPSPSEREPLYLKAVRALAQLPPHHAVPRLIELARSHPTRSVRTAAVHHLGRFDDQRTADVLIELVGHAGDPAVALAALQQLGRIEGPPTLRAVKAVSHVARSASDPTLCRAAVLWLGRSNSQAAADALMELIRAAPPQAPPVAP